MFDKAVADIQNELAGKLSWLDHVFGICEKNTRMIDGKKFNIATVFTGNEQYSQIEPCAELGNFCFFVLKDPQELGANDKYRIHCPISCIFWYDMRQISNSISDRNREAVKAEILNVMNKLHLSNGVFIFNKVYEDPKNVFSEFSYDYVDNQFLMSPYAGVRIEGTLYTDVPCYN